MTKEEKIKLEYNGLESELIDENGWTKYNVDDNSEFGIEPFGDYETRNHKERKYEWRPKSLSGIENNNGWNILKGIKNEITHDGDIWILNKHGNIELWLESQFLAIGYATHWKPVIKPKPPIY